ncbi:class I adenylate-forming enzyme family protein [Streptomyces sp. NPDC006372]|uniref:class I adenylate-forming enzyme family protein n=1 Tax=Streptomyces sp. NPDC006372 TaxID=3155599 RepID=UPI0033AF6E3B
MSSISHYEQDEALRIGELFSMGAALHPHVRFTLDHPLTMFPESGTELTYSQLADHVAETAARLSSADVGPGKKVVLFASNTFDLVLLTCAIAQVGAVPVLLSPKLTGDVVAQLVAKCDRPVLLTDAATLAGPLDGLDLSEVTSRVLLISDESAAHVSLAKFAGSPRRAPVRLAPDDLCLITHTSGTTGLPKLVMQSSRSLWWHLKPQLRSAKKLNSREARGICVSFVHVRTWPLLWIALYRGQHTVVLSAPDPDKAAELFSAVKPGMLEAHPNCYILWEKLAEDPRGPLANVRYFVNTFDAMHPRTMRILLAASRRKMPLYLQGYGQSEVGPISLRIYNRQLAKNADGRCQGFTARGVSEVKIGTAASPKSGPNRIGPILVRSQGHSLGLLGDAEQFAERFSGGWWRTGDLGYRTKWGCVHLLDREVDHIDGVTSNLEIEDRLMEHLPELTEVVLVTDGAGKVAPVIATHNDKPLAVHAWKRATAGLPEMREPLHCRWTDLPMTSTWKVRRQVLTTMITEGALPLLESAARA